MKAELAQMVVDVLREARIDLVGGVDDQRNGFLDRRYGWKFIPRLETPGIEIFKDGESSGGRIRSAVRMMHVLKQPVALLFLWEFTEAG